MNNVTQNLALHNIFVQVVLRIDIKKIRFKTCVFEIWTPNSLKKIPQTTLKNTPKDINLLFPQTFN